jgi:riboflavin synthase
VFTGIIEETGQVAAIEQAESSARLTINATTVLSGTRLGDSIAVSGVCLTVTALTDTTFTADVMYQTLKLTRLGALRPGDRVNLERAVRADGRLGGHIVSGHIDGLGQVVSDTPGPNWHTVVISAPPALARFIAGQGSIAVDGVSRTIARVDGCEFSVGLIPATLRATTLGDLHPGQELNLETDILAKYLDRLLSADAGGNPQ